MTKIIDLDTSTETPEPSAVALGNFDGMHLGHRALFNLSLEISEESEIQSSVLFFKNHTRANMFYGFRQMQAIDDKVALATEMGIDQIFTITFDDHLMQLSPEDFFHEILVKKCNVKKIICGPDYKFGKQAQGNIETLEELSKGSDIDVCVVKMVKMEGARINSTEIREEIRKGEITNVTNMLGRPYVMRGVVGHGKKRGRQLGFPTANLFLQFPYMIPADGVYITFVEFRGKKYPSLTNIGNNPTFENEEKKIEVFVIDFSGNLYGEEIKVTFLEYLRPDMYFPNRDELIVQMNKDLEAARTYFQRKDKFKYDCI